MSINRRTWSVDSRDKHMKYQPNAPKVSNLSSPRYIIIIIDIIHLFPALIHPVLLLALAFLM